MRAVVLRHSPRDALLVGLSIVHAALLLTIPSAPLIALMSWWNANTIAHNFIHLPFFRDRRANALFSGWLSLLLGLPQTLWRDRHLAHHAGHRGRLRLSRRLALETLLVATQWSLILTIAPHFFLTVWLPGWAGGMLLCTLQGHYEHVRGTVSHYGKLYNLAFFNDGYHVEHHARPGQHWTTLPRLARPEAEKSSWPAVLRWLEVLQLDTLERLVLHSPRLQRFVVDRHARAFRRLIRELPPIRRVAIIGGGLFPRTTLVLRQVLPDAEITVIDRSPENLRRASPWFAGDVHVVEANFSPGLCSDADLLIVPLAFVGDRQTFYRDPPAPAVAVHDWIWQKRGAGTVVSVLLLKRLNLVRR